MRSVKLALLLLALSPLSSARANVVINEVFYNAPNDMDDVQWVEIHNTAVKPVALAGWTLDEGKTYTFPKAAKINGNGYLVVALRPAKVKKLYGVDALGPLKRPLKRGSERLELRDAAKKLVDTARYKDRAPWLISADGYSSSLERICPVSPGDVPQNWAASPLPAVSHPAGTPGKPNAAYSPALPPLLTVPDAPDLLKPHQPLDVEAEVTGGKAKAVTLLYRIVSGGVQGKETALPMTAETGGTRYRARIPGSASGTLIRFRIKAVGATGAARLYPAAYDLSPTLSTYVHEEWNSARLPFALILHGGAKKPPALLLPPRMFRFDGLPPEGFDGPPPGDDSPPVIHLERRPFGGPPPDKSNNGEARERVGPPPGGPPRPGGGPPGGFPPSGPPGGFPPGGPPDGFEGGPPPFMNRDREEEPKPPRGTSTLVYVDPESKKTTLFDHLNVIPRDGGRGYRVFFHKDHTLNGMSAVNIDFEGSERFLMAEALAYDVYRRAGSPAPQSEFVRVWVDGKMIGYHLMIERLNKSFLRRNEIDPDGNLYKLLWFGQGIAGQHEKKTHTQTGHQDLLTIIDRLEKTEGDAQWKVIQENFDVDEVATYFAVNMILSHWDGFFNNYFTYHDTGGTKKWQMFPWDQDKTWGYYDGLPDNEVFYDMPITFGMNGDTPPGMEGGFPGGGFPGGPFGGPPRGGGPRFNGGPGAGPPPDGVAPGEVGPSPSEGPPFNGGRPMMMGGGMWWRQPVYFSGPLLANPQFRKVFLARVREILDKVYTQETYFPLIDEMADRLKEDVRLRAQYSGTDPETALQDLAHNVDLFKTHLLKRRQFLLEQKSLAQGSR